jgi:hypothetical protein
MVSKLLGPHAVSANALVQPTSRIRRQPSAESLFRTLKYRPDYRVNGFATVDDARLWVASFVHWYNHEHQHSGIGFVTAADRHAGIDLEILAARRCVYARARRRQPERAPGRAPTSSLSTRNTTWPPSSPDNGFAQYLALTLNTVCPQVLPGASERVFAKGEGTR